MRSPPFNLGRLPFKIIKHELTKKRFPLAMISKNFNSIGNEELNAETAEFAKKRKKKIRQDNRMNRMFFFHNLSILLIPSKNL